MKKIITSIFLCLQLSVVFAQIPSGQSTPIMQTPLVESTNSSNFQGTLLNFLIDPKDADIELYPPTAHVEERKDELAKLRNLTTNKIVKSKPTRGNAPYQASNFQANLLYFLIPADNCIGISKKGNIISGDNNTLVFADSTGAIIKDTILWNDFLNNNVNFQSGKYDPRIIYDNVHDRFIVMVMHGPGNVAKNKIIIAYSKTNNPIDGFNIYSLSGNPFNDTSWADYPSIGINNNELFISVNLFAPSPTYDYHQSVIYQINLANGYGGATNLNYKIWASHITTPDGKPAFTIVPVIDGLGQSSNSSNMWFVSTWPEMDTSVFAYQITNELFDPSAQLLTYQYKIPEFNVCANAMTYNPPTNQYDSISTGSSITQNAYLIDSMIHFTFDANIDTGWCGIQYGRIDLRNKKATIKTFGEKGKVYAYPSIANFGYNEKDKSAVICFLKADTLTYPQIDAVAIDDAMNFSSPIVLRKGDTAVSWGSGPSTKRWGDYTGIQKKYNSNPPEAWCGGSYATGNRKRKAIYNTWVSQLFNTNFATPITSISKNNNTTILYPNPVNQYFNFSFTNDKNQNVMIKIINTQGQIVKELYNNDLDIGNQTFHFNKGVLAKGNYFLVIASNTNKQSVPFIVE